MVLPACVLVMCCILTGCWDAVDIDRRDICTAIILDRQGDQFAIYAEIAEVTGKKQNTTGDKGGVQQNGTVVVCGRGATIPTARLNLDRALNKPLYLGAVQVLILTERMAEYGVEEYVMRLRQLNEYRKTMDVIITPDEPEAFLQVTPENDASVGFATEDTIETLRRKGRAYHMSLADLMEKHASKNPCYLLTTMSAKTGQIYPVGLMVMDHGKKIGFIPNEESNAFAIFTKKQAKIMVEDDVPMDGAHVAVEAKLKSRCIKVRWDGEKAVFTVTVKVDARVQYPNSERNITQDIARQLEESLVNQITGKINQTIEASQKNFHCDYLSFGEDFRIAEPEIYEDNKWQELFDGAEFSVRVFVQMLESRIIDYNPRGKM